MPRTSRFLALIAAVALVAAACGGGGNGKSQQSQSAALKRGGKAKTISGLSAPDPSTLAVTLTKPAGYFPFVFTLPATAPIPAAPNDPNAPLGVATGHSQNYGQFLSSTGPYMFKGADQIDYSKPVKDQTAPSG